MAKQVTLTCCPPVYSAETAGPVSNPQERDVAANISSSAPAILRCVLLRNESGLMVGTVLFSLLCSGPNIHIQQEPDDSGNGAWKLLRLLEGDALSDYKLVNWSHHHYNSWFL